MKYENKEWEINFKDLFFFVLYKWKMIVVFGVVFALLLGGLQVWRSRSAQTDLETLESTLTILEQEMQAEQNTLDNIVRTHEDLQTYMAESEMMCMDYHNAYEANAQIFVTTRYEIMPDMAYQSEDNTDTIIELYRQLVRSNAVIGELAETVGMKTKYVRELVSVGEKTGNLLSLSVWHSDPDMAEEILDGLVEKMYASRDAVAEYVEEHELTVIRQTVAEAVESTIRDKQDTEIARLIELSESIVDQEKKIATLDGKVKTAQKNLDNAAASGKGGLRAMAKTGIKWGILGGVAGAVLCAGVYCVMFVFRDTVYSAEELRKRMLVKLIGSVDQNGKKRDIFTRLFRKLEGRGSRDAGETLDLLAANLQTYCGDSKTVLVAGGENPDSNVWLTEQLQQRMTNVKLVSGKSVVNDAETVKQLRECDGVVLVAHCNRSRYKQLSWQMERVEDARKHLIGCVVVE